MEENVTEKTSRDFLSGKRIKTSCASLFCGIALMPCVFFILLIQPLRWYPTSESIGHKYFDAVIDRDLEKAMSVYDPECRSAIRWSVKDDIDQYGGAEIRNL